MTNNIFTPANILIPKTSPEKWSVIACDQFSSQKEYWESAKRYVGDAPSTLNMIIPEAYLAETDEETQAKKISAAMEKYLGDDIFNEHKDSLIYVERTQPDGRVRKGMVGAIDLEEYEFKQGNNAAIRASEGTILERLPARINIRKAAPIELPHIIAFINDKNGTVIEPLAEKSANLETAYDFTLMQGGGHITGKRVKGDDANSVISAINALRKNSENSKNSEILMIIGDGNHSLAGAKVYWNELKNNLSTVGDALARPANHPASHPANHPENHPARRALVEVCNVYDSAIDFEAIHRVLFDIDPPAFVKAFKGAMPRGDDYTIKWVAKEGSGDIGIKAACIGDMLEHVQAFIDNYLKKATPGSEIDYVHGEDSVKNLAQNERSLGLILPAMDKSELFETVAIRGVFPRKSFSVGHAKDKRYYLECRKII